MTTIESSEDDDLLPKDATEDYLDVDALYARLEDAESEDDRRYWRRRIVEKAMPLADHIAYRFVNRGESRDDVLQVARLALVKAVHRYDRSKGRFVSFAVPTVFGEIRRHFRDNTWGMHVPRRYQEVTLALRTATADLTQRTGHTPTVQELAAELDMSPEEVRNSQAARQAYRPLSLDETIATSDRGRQSRIAMQGADDPNYAKVEDVLVLTDLMRELPMRERQILHMRFYDCLRQRDIARCLGISQVHVSRLLSATLEQLRLRMCAQGIAILVALSFTACQFH